MIKSVVFNPTPKPDPLIEAQKKVKEIEQKDACLGICSRVIQTLDKLLPK